MKSIDSFSLFLESTNEAEVEDCEWDISRGNNCGEIDVGLLTKMGMLMKIDLDVYTPLKIIRVRGLFLCLKFISF